jgi:hypothetical protein
MTLEGTLEKLNNLIEGIEYQIRMLKHRPKLFWDALYVREDEFHKSTDMDIVAMMDMNKEDRSKYTRDLCRRRDIAHRRDLGEDI